MRFFTADLHLGHKSIIDNCHRPFASIEEMDAALISNINASVTKSDMLYIIGDFSLGNFATVCEQRKKIVCPQVFLLRGNHDGLSSAQYEKAGFIFKGDICDLKMEDGQKITLCHYAMRRWNCSHHGAWQLYGHSHGHLADDPKSFSFDAGVDPHGYSPLSYDRVREIMSFRSEAVAEPNHLD